MKLENIGKEYHSYLTHIINNYENLSKINFFFSASFMKLKERTRNFTKIYKKISSLGKKNIMDYIHLRIIIFYLKMKKIKF